MGEEYIDLQVNGYKGVDFSSPELSEDDFLRSAEAVFDSGTVVFLPTIVTGPEDLYRRNIGIIHDAASSHGLLSQIPGVHLEGPFLSPEPGAVGCHSPEFVQEPSIPFFDRLYSFAGSFLRMMTVAAERPGAPELIRYASGKGVRISLGHHLAGSADLNAAAEAGAVALTHLGNGCPNLLDRHRNPIWAGLACDSLTAMLITDGHHLPAEVVKCMAKIKGADKMIVTSDAAPVAGLPPGRYHMLGNDAILEPNGKFHNPEKGCLVGSASGMRECVAFLRSLNLFSDAEIRKVSYDTPKRLIGC